MSDAKKKLTELRAAISKLTGRLPISTDVDYLAKRLEDLKVAKQNGENVKKAYVEPHVNFAVSVTPDQNAAVSVMASTMKVGRSKLVRLALAEFAKKHGHPSAVAAFEKES